MLPDIASATCLKPNAMQGAIADTASTVIAINLFDLKEMNPLGAIGSTAIKIVALHSAKDLTKEDKQSFDNKAGSFWMGATINNVLAIAGATFPISLLAGIISGMIFYNMPECDHDLR